MGSPAGEGAPDEHPQRVVTLSAYYIDRTEVTVAAYAACVGSGRCSVPAIGERCNWNVSGYEQHPVNCVDWHQASAYCAAQGGRLPTEAEWEFAARGTDGRTYPWGNSAPDHTRLNAIGSEAGLHVRMYNGNDGFPLTAPVGSYPAGASPYGVLDVAGNVWEWTSDWYGSYPAGNVADPRGAASGQYRTSRGGGWSAEWRGGVRAAVRSARVSPAEQGFRCARGA